MPRLKLLHLNFYAFCVFLPAQSHFEGILSDFPTGTLGHC